MRRRSHVALVAIVALLASLTGCALAPAPGVATASPERQLAEVGLRTTDAIGRVRVTLRTGYESSLYASDQAQNRARYRTALQALERVSAANVRVAAGLAAYEAAQVALLPTTDTASQVQAALTALDEAMRALGVSLQGTGVAGQVAALTLEVTRLTGAIRDLVSPAPTSTGGPR